MNDNSIPMTLNGYNKLQDELKNLRNVERPAVINAISSARALGDLSENAEYHSAKEKQSIIESRISEIENKLSKATIIDVSNIDSDVIKFGASVEIVDDDTDVVSNFQIVGSDEADIKSGLLPITSPLARALIGKKVDDSIDVHTPGGIKSYTILSVVYK
ncbi:MAG: transcription elongation factor GreA [Alphaproteobacteria bacterium]|nr:transcription elongation factor GreA [Alphaproteobacteria bacterium]